MAAKKVKEPIIVTIEGEQYKISDVLSQKRVIVYGFDEDFDFLYVDPKKGTPIIYTDKGAKRIAQAAKKEYGWKKYKILTIREFIWDNTENLDIRQMLWWALTMRPDLDMNEGINFSFQPYFG